MKRTTLLASISAAACLSLALSSLAQGADSNALSTFDYDKCLAQANALPAAQQAGGLEGCKVGQRLAQQVADEAAHDKATAHSWAGSLDALPAGGWVPLTVDPYGQFALFATRRQLTREGAKVDVWVRWEYRRPRAVDTRTFKSSTNRLVVDCVRQVQQLVAQSLYAGNNLQDGLGDDFVGQENAVNWEPEAPGTVGEYINNWACNNVPVHAKQAPKQ